MTGYGQDGPMAQAVGHDLNYIAQAGVLGMIGRRGQPPTPPLSLIGDFGGGGLLLAFGILAAIVERASSGEGQVVDAAMVEGAALLATPFFGYPQTGAWTPSAAPTSSTAARRSTTPTSAPTARYLTVARWSRSSTPRWSSCSAPEDLPDSSTRSAGRR